MKLMREIVGQVDRRAKQPAVFAGNDFAHQLHAPFGVVLRIAQAGAHQALQALAGGLVVVGANTVCAEQGACGRKAKGE
jgi:predicted house-cleaning NTP pyrophosphatase (Maf/HAM1 superfamily)